MKYRSKLKYSADTYFFRIAKVSMFITAVFTVSVLYLVCQMSSYPALAIKYYCAIPKLIQNVLLVCAAAVSVGVIFEIGTN